MSLVLLPYSTTYTTIRTIITCLNLFLIRIINIVDKIFFIKLYTKSFVKKYI